MPRLIDADKLRKDILDLPNCYNGYSDTYDKACIIDMIDEQPTVESVRHAHWIRKDYDIECSECHARIDERDLRWAIDTEAKYCLNCGCKMDEVTDAYEEPEINPCRGCGDYDGKGGCLSHGGCGERREDG